MENTPKAPGFILLAAGVVAFVVCVVDFALGQVGVGVAAIVVALLAAGGGLAWLGMEGRRLRQVERASQRNNGGAH
jgi:Flp pilus assembly protein TadB